MSQRSLYPDLGEPLPVAARAFQVIRPDHEVQRAERREDGRQLCVGELWQTAEGSGGELPQLTSQAHRRGAAGSGDELPQMISST